MRLLFSHPGEVKELAGVSFSSLFQELGVQDEVSARFGIYIFINHHPQQLCKATNLFFKFHFVCMQ